MLTEEDNRNSKGHISRYHRSVVTLCVLSHSQISELLLIWKEAGAMADLLPLWLICCHHSWSCAVKLASALSEWIAAPAELHRQTHASHHVVGKILTVLSPGATLTHAPSPKACIVVV